MDNTAAEYWYFDTKILSRYNVRKSNMNLVITTTITRRSRITKHKNKYRVEIIKDTADTIVNTSSF